MGKHRIDFRIDSQSILVVDMSISKNNKVNIPIVEVESSSSASISVDRPADEGPQAQSDESSSTSSDESTSVEIGRTQPISFDFDKRQDLPTRLDTDDGIIRVLSPRALTDITFDVLTIPVASPLEPSIPRTSCAKVIATGLTTRDLANPSTLQGEGVNSNSFEELQRAKN